MAEMSIAQAAAALGVSVDTIRRRVKRGELETHRTNDGRLVVIVADQPQPAGESPTPAPSGEDTERLRLELEHSRALLGEVQRHREDLQARLARAEQALQREAEQRTELHILLRTAQQQAVEAQQQLGRLLPAPREEAKAEGEAEQGTRRHWWQVWKPA